MAIRIQKPPVPPTTPPQDEEITLSATSARPLLTLREGVVFPHTESVLVFGREFSKLAIEAAEREGHEIVIAAQRTDKSSQPLPKDIHKIATLAKIERILRHEDEFHVLVRGIKRVRIVEFVQSEPFFTVEVKELDEMLDNSDEFRARLNYLITLFKQTIQSGKPVEFFNFMKLMSGASTHELIDHIASTLEISTTEKQKILSTLNVADRLAMVTEQLERERNILDIEEKITKSTKERFDERMRENILRERMQVIQKELGELDDQEELQQLEDRLIEAKLPRKYEEKVAKEIHRLAQMSPMHAEYAYLHTWVETILSLPWNKRSRERTSLKRAAQVLDQQHYGLEKVKERILEHLAVLKLRQKQPMSKKDTQRSPLATILCFVGPPGVGKTSIGRSIAAALGREFVKVSLGGVRDEAEIRGHRRTYVGAMPGRIMQALKNAETRNPVFMLDEIDKLGADFRGDPSAALLEVLDPEQNHEFTDHYIDLPFDISEVMFITTANVLHTIPDALRDRLEIIEYSGYTHDEKYEIARRYLLEQVRKAAGLKEEQFKVSPAALRSVITHYTRESGVRNLKRELATLARKAARHLAEKNAAIPAIAPKHLPDLLGPHKFLGTIQEKEDEVGLVNGLAWTSVGGELLPIEASIFPGKGTVQLTGQLGKVMQESARAALTFVKSHAKDLGIDPKIFEKTQIHIHVPEGAVPKDGPSAGVAMALALTSVFTNKPVPHTLAMTGEITLRGRVLPIGGVKEKLIAAHRAGMKTVFVPKRNEKDLVEVPKSVKEDLTILPVERAEEVLTWALDTKK